MLDTLSRDQFFTRPNGDKAALPFSAAEYDRRLAGLRPGSWRRKASMPCC